MTEPTPDLPDWIEEKISYNDKYEVQDHFFIEPLVETNRAWLSRSTIEEEAGVSDETARTRLRRLEEKEIVNSAPGGDGTVYWIHDERSDWPIPPDIDFPDTEESKSKTQDEITIGELLERKPVIGGIIAAAAAILSTLLIALGIGPIIIGVEMSVVQQLAELFLVVGFLGALFSTGLLGGVAIIYFTIRLRRS